MMENIDYCSLFLVFFFLFLFILFIDIVYIISGLSVMGGIRYFYPLKMVFGTS